MCDIGNVRKTDVDKMDKHCHPYILETILLLPMLTYLDIQHKDKSPILINIAFRMEIDLATLFSSND